MDATQIVCIVYLIGIPLTFGALDATAASEEKPDGARYGALFILAAFWPFMGLAMVGYSAGRRLSGHREGG